MTVFLPASDRRYHGPALTPALEQQSAESRLERDVGRVRAQKRMAPPPAGVAGERGEHLRGGSVDRDVEREINRQVGRLHPPSLILFDIPLESQQSRRPSGRERVVPALVQALERHGIEVVPALAAALAARDKPGLRQELEVAHNGDPRYRELRGDLAGDPRPGAEQVEDAMTSSLTFKAPERDSTGSCRGSSQARLRRREIGAERGRARFRVVPALLRAR